MDIKKIKQVVDLMKRSDILELEFEEEGLKLKIRRNSNGEFQLGPAAPAPIMHMPAYTTPPFPMPQAAAPTLAAESTPAPQVEDDLLLIKSPMVGTFYAAPSPTDPDFVSVGSKVDSSSVVCIIEAMKVMNEIQAENSGTIAEVFVKSGEIVEFGQPLFKLKV